MISMGRSENAESFHLPAERLLLEAFSHHVSSPFPLRLPLVLEKRLQEEVLTLYEETLTQGVSTAHSPFQLHVTITSKTPKPKLPR